jgi:catechol 2,3-dioxygenase-like lactoylglutathione lyase family enzyme
MDFSQLQAISDVCLLVQNLDRSVAFYTDKLGFTVVRRTDGFAAFNSQSVSLVVWETSHFPDEPRAPGLAAAPRAEHKACLSVKLPSPADVDALYGLLQSRDISFQRPPSDYPWRARCCYFSDPDNYLWEIYADL